MHIFDHILHTLDTAADLHIDVAVNLVKQVLIVGHYPPVHDHLIHHDIILLHRFMPVCRTSSGFYSSILGVAVSILLHVLDKMLKKFLVHLFTIIQGEFLLMSHLREADE